MLPLSSTRSRPSSGWLMMIGLSPDKSNKFRIDVLFLTSKTASLNCQFTLTTSPSEISDGHPMSYQLLDNRSK